MHHFQTADIICNPLLPFCVAALVSFFTSMAGLSGAFLLLPFQMSVLGFVGPAVSATNHLFNIVAAPAGVYRYYKEGRFIWPITKTIIIGTLPGVFLGAFVRVKYLPDPSTFKIFAGVVLIGIGIKVAHTYYTTDSAMKLKKSQDKDIKCIVLGQTSKVIALKFLDSTYYVLKLHLSIISFIVGIIGGIYGIGGGAIMSPFLVSFLRLPIYVVAGATLCATAVTSLAGVVFFMLLSPVFPELNVRPDILLGLTLGFGGMCGMYFGAKCQKYVSSDVLQLFLMTILYCTGFQYIMKNLYIFFK